MAVATKPLGRDFAEAIIAIGGNTDRIAASTRTFEAFFFAIGRDDEGARLRDDALTRAMLSTTAYCFEKGRHVSEVGPPGIGKSTRDRMFALYRLGRDPRNTIAFVSADRDIAVDNTSFCRAMIVSNDAVDELGLTYRQLFPSIIPDFERNQMSGARGWRRDKFFIVREGQSVDAAIQAKSATPKGEATRLRMLFADDIMTRQVAYSRTERESLKKTFKQTWIGGRLSNGGWAKTNQNCWHQEDQAHELLRDRRFCSIWVGVAPDCDRMFVRIYNPPDGLPLIDHPEKFDAIPTIAKREAHAEFLLPLPSNETYTVENLRELKSNMGKDFNQLYELVALSDSDRMYPSFPKREKRDGMAFEVLGVGERNGLPVFDANDRFRFAISLGYDISSLTRRGDAVWVLAKDSQHRIYPVEFHVGSFTIEEVVELFDDIWGRGVHFNPANVETNAVQDKIAEAVATRARQKNRAWARRIKPFITTGVKHDPSLGLRATDLLFGNGEILWPDGESAAGTEQAAGWLQAEADFRSCPMLLKANETPDSVMAFWFALKGLDLVAGGARVQRTRGLNGRSRNREIVARF